MSTEIRPSPAVENQEISNQPTRDEINALNGIVVLEFGATWCGHCKAAQAHVDATIKQDASVRYIWVEDGPGRRLGRSYSVKLWPTLIFLNHGQEIERLVRPTDTQSIMNILNKVKTAA